MDTGKRKKKDSCLLSSLRYSKKKKIPNQINFKKKA